MMGAVGLQCHTLRHSLPYTPMSSDSEPLGECPKCGAAIGPSQILVEYEKDDGTTNKFVDCVSCGQVVRPE
jgi:predicted RNA-binding Zn-ribbon protein involved in translation (DUF1610 family)